MAPTTRSREPVEEEEEVQAEGSGTQYEQASHDPTVRFSSEHQGGERSISRHDYQEDILETLTTAISRLPKGSGGSSKPRKPDTFDGSSPEKLRTFLFQLRLCFRASPNDFPDDQTKVLTALSYLRGPPLDWFEARLPINDDDEEAPEYMSSWTAFSRELVAHFGRADDQSHYERQLHQLRMESNGRVTDYIMTFDQYASRLKWGDEALRSRFYEGLNNRLKDRLADLPDGRPTTLASMKSRVRAIDQRYWERAEERKASKETSTSNSSSQGKSGGSGSGSGSGSNNSGNSGSNNKSGRNSSNNNNGDKNKSNQSSSSSSNSKGSNSNNSNNSSNKSANNAAYKSLLGKDGKLLPAEKQRHIDNNLCLVCGKSGHTADECRHSSRNKSNPKARAATTALTPPAETPEAKKA